MGTVYVENRHSHNVVVEVRGDWQDRATWITWDYRHPVTAERITVRHGDKYLLKPGEGVEVFLKEEQQVVTRLDQPGRWFYENL